VPGERAEPYFFLSYARTPRHGHNSSTDPDYWLHKFYDDLYAEVLQRIRTPVAGFMDREIGLGTQWSEELTKALATCRVFVPLYSPRFFDSENCGKEWYAFSKRVLDQRARQPNTQMAIVPALWVPVEDDGLPDVAKAIQFNHRDLGDIYGQTGFFGIIKLDRFSEEYMLAVQNLARRIVEVGTHRRTGRSTSQSRTIQKRRPSGIRYRLAHGA